MDALFRWIVAGVFAAGSPFVVIGGNEALATARELGRGARAEGTVVGNRLVSDRRDGVDEHAYVPEVEFRDLLGHSVRFTDGTGSLPPDYAVGERVQVSFARENPTRARILSWKRLWLAPTIFIVAGLLPGLVVAIVLWRVGRRMAR